MSRSDANDTQVTDVASHAQSHFAVDMVAQQGTTLQAGSNTEPRPTQPAPIVSAMAAASGAHELEAMANYPNGCKRGGNQLRLVRLGSQDPGRQDDCRLSTPPRRPQPHPSDRNRSGSRVGSVKRAADSGGRPPRGRPGSPWEDDIRPVHRGVQYPDDPNASVQTALQALQRQSEADRDHMAMLKHAIETIYVSQQQQMVDVTAVAQRSDRIEGVIERDRAITRTEL